MAVVSPINESLSEHVHVLKGSREDTKKLLLEAGWPEQQVNDYVARTFKNVPNESVLSVHGVVKSFQDHKVLQGIDLDVRKGEIFGIIGMSGTGKTTLLNVIVGFLRPDAGDVLLSVGNSSVGVLKNASLVKRHIGFSTQTPSFYPKLTVRENLEHFARLYRLSGSDIARRSNSLLDLVGLVDARDVLAAHLSGGMQKRLDIACALVHDPDVLILDEPTADLDPVLRKQFWELIRKVNAKGTTILLASHFLAEIELLCNRIAILQNGRVVELGTADELRQLYSRNYELFLQTASKDYRSVIQHGRRFFYKFSEEDGELVIQTPFPERVLNVISSTVSRGDVVSLHISRPTLGRVFEAVVKR
ncbi:ABC transporter ATP-binding protein [Candidatus Woesearchaeota archaeon]|nr:ABC transporter ATP-binding protein [Candidatus Woesearchaeota archaeon]